MRFFVALLIFIVCFNISQCIYKFRKVFAWSKLDYAFFNEEDRAFAISTNRFIPENNLPVGIEIWKDKIFVTVPRWREGIPSTLNYVLRQNTETESPLLIPYPDWKSNELGNCETGLNTVYRVKADACNRLWVLDTGTFGIGNTTQNPCPYALNIFDLNTNRRIRRYQLHLDDITPNTFIANIAVDVRSCNDAFAYMSDELGYGLIVYSWKENRSWRFSHSYFMPDPLVGDFNIGGLNFQWGEEGIFGMSLSPLLSNFERLLFFNPLASNRGFFVSTKILRNSSKVGNSYHDFVALEERGMNFHTTAHVMSDNGIELFNLIDQNAVGCWNFETPYNNVGIVDKDDNQLIFPSDIKIDDNEYVWVLSDKMSNFLLSNLDYNDVNFRIFVASLKDLISNTVCDVKHNNLNYFVNFPLEY